jgi:hypothetical protein
MASFLLGLAPEEGCLAAALLQSPVVSYTTFSPSPYGSLFLWPNLAGYLKGFPAPGVTRLLALWSADFPRHDKCRDHLVNLVKIS